MTYPETSEKLVGISFHKVGGECVAAPGIGRRGKLESAFIGIKHPPAAMVLGEALMALELLEPNFNDAAFNDSRRFLHNLQISLINILILVFIIFLSWCLNCKYFGV